MIDNIYRACEAEGFVAAQLVRLDSPLLEEAELHLKRYLEKNHHATMGWMERKRAHPQKLWPEAKSALVLGASYHPDQDPLPLLKQKTSGLISVYALGEDYHRVLTKKAKAIAQKMTQTLACQAKVFVDTAPLMEKPLAVLANLGWQGKHSNVVSKELGSWFFLALVLTDLELDEKHQPAQHENHCGSCDSCLTICPTDAFVAPYQLDSRKCISYLTIEHKGHIDRALRAKMGNRIYGCDDCLAVCPWNKFAHDSQRMKALAPTQEQAPPLLELLSLSDEQFRERFRHNPIKRIGRERFLRNVLIAIGNSQEIKFISALEKFIGDPAPLLRLAAVWALAQLASPERFQQLKEAYLKKETDEAVLAEWNYSP